MVSTLNELSHLSNSGFGQPPRHGLNLLYWFAHDYINFSSEEIVLRFRPQNGDFGFHKFLNRIEDDEHIVPIPNQDLTYYEVGNLNYRGAEKLPSYVRGNYSHVPDGNKDRIIVRLDANSGLNRVYVTEHSDAIRFDSSKTHRVSQGLLQIIKNMSRDQFLSEVSKTQQQHVRLQQQSLYQNDYNTHHVTPTNNDSWCTIL